MTFVSLSPLTASGFGMVMTPMGVAPAAIESGNADLALESTGEEIAAVSSFTMNDGPSYSYKLIPVPGGMLTKGPEIKEAPVTASMIHPIDIDLFDAPSSSTANQDHTMAFALLGALLLVSAIPLAMTFGTRTKQILSSMLGLGSDSKPEAKPRVEAAKDSPLNPVRIGGEHRPGASLMPPPNPGDQYGKRGIH